MGHVRVIVSCQKIQKKLILKKKNGFLKQLSFFEVTDWAGRSTQNVSLAKDACLGKFVQNYSLAQKNATFILH